MNASLRMRQVALIGIFFIAGMALGSWVTRIPAVRDILGANTAQMGLLLSCASVGSFLGIMLSGPIVSRWGARRVISVAFAVNTLGLPIVGLGTLCAYSWLVGMGLFFIGFGAACGDVAMNVEGGQVERESGHVFMTYLHGGFSLGNLLGALFGMVAQATNLSIVIHLCSIAVINAFILLWCVKKMPERTGYTGRMFNRRLGSANQKPVWKDWRLLLIGVIVITLALSEGTASNWLPLVMVDGHGVTPTFSTVVYVLFVASMTLGRFISGFFVERFGSARVLIVSALIVVTGIGLIAFVDSWVVATVAAALWGLGAASGFPLALSAAGRSGHNPTARVALASITGYLAFLSGPSILGFAGQAWGLRYALIIPMVGACFAAILAPVTNVQHPESRGEESAES
ncbi:MFS transporter [Actinotignum urinale]|uniref:MFS transporter n=1 Tax=Actinotignum urinale TaxID=190146 RepID=UPI0003B7AD94|nr:MFS transporter [Actinotignum urinale]MDY5159516.1 MFS transporter [Actinotignum urinale]